MTVKKRHSARFLRERNRLSRYLHTHGYGRLADGYAEHNDEKLTRSRVLYAVVAIMILSVGAFFVIF